MKNLAEEGECMVIFLNLITNRKEIYNKSEKMSFSEARSLIAVLQSEQKDLEYIHHVNRTRGNFTIKFVR